MNASSNKAPLWYGLAGAGLTLLLVVAVLALWPGAPGAGGAAEGTPQAGAGPGAAGGAGGAGEGGPEGPGGPGGPGGGGPGGFGPAPVEVVPAVRTRAAEPVRLPGTVEPLKESVVASEVDGVVEEVAVDEGDTVRAGSLLARLRTTTMEAQLDAAQAAQAEAEARLVSAEADAERLARLRDSGAISQREYESAVAERDALRQSVSRFAAEAAHLEELIRRAHIEAPFAGQATEVHVEIGEWVARGGAVATLVDTSSVEITVPVPERFVSAVRIGFPVRVEIPALPGRSYEGNVRAVVPQAIASARTFPVVVRLVNPRGHIQAGMQARVVAQVGEAEPAVLVPKDGIVTRRDRHFVYVVQGDGDVGPARELQVELGAARGQWQVVLGTDVADGDRVVVLGNERLQPNQPVRVVAVQDIEPPTADPDRPVAKTPR